MNVNLELYLLYNTCMNGLVLALTARLSGILAVKKRKIWRWIFSASVLGSVFSVLILANEWTREHSAPCLLTGVGVMAFMAFGKMPLREFFRIFGLAIILSCVLGGIGFLMLSQFGGVWSYTLAAGLCVAAGVIIRFLDFSRRRLAQAPNIVTLKLIIDAQSVEPLIFTALIDSGNSLVEPISGRSVVVLSNKVFQITPDLPGFRLVPFRTISGGGVMPCFRPMELSVNDEPILAYVAVSAAPMQGVEALIPPAALLHDKGGCQYGNARF